MSLESGSEENGTKAPQNVDDLFKVIAELQNQVKSLQGNSIPQPAVTPGLSAEQFAQILKAVKEKGDVDFDEGLEEQEIPIEDFDEVGVVFYTPCVGRILVDDKRKGRRVKLPYNKKFIFFEYEATRRMQQGKYEAIAPFSKYRSHSKKEIEWLRNHTDYRITFYESSTEAANADILMMKKLTRIMTTLVNYTLPDIIKRCKEYNVMPSDDPQIMRHHLAIAMAKKELESEGVVTEVIVKSNQKEKEELLKQ